MSRMDLTNGPILKGIVGLSVPMIASSILQSMQSLVDMYFVGVLGPDAIAAVGMSGTVIMVLATVFMGINTATMAMVARAIGAQDEPRARHVAGQSLVLTAIFSVIIGAAGYLVSPLLLKMLGGEGAVVKLGADYLRITFIGIFFMCVSFVISGILQAAGDAVTPMLLGILTTVLNVILTPIFVFGSIGVPRMEVQGSALSTVIARALTLVIWGVAIAHGRLRVRVGLRDLIPSWMTMWRITCIGIPSSLQMSFRALMDVVLMTLVAQFGTLSVAAYSVGVRLRMVGLFPIFGFANAAATMVGQNLGAGKLERSRRSAWVATGISFATASVAALGFCVFADWLIGLFNSDPSVIRAGADFLRITSLGLMAAAVGIVLGRSLNGAGDTLSPLIITLVALWGFQIPAAVYLSGIPRIYGVDIPGTRYLAALATDSVMGIWYAILVASFLQAAAVSVWFSTGRWKKARV